MSQDNYYQQGYGIPQQGGPVITSITSDPYEELDRGSLRTYRWACILFGLFSLTHVVTSIRLLMDDNILKTLEYVNLVTYGIGAVGGVFGYLSNHQRDLAKAKLALVLFIAHIVIYLSALTYIGMKFDFLSKLLLSMIRTIIICGIIIYGSIESIKVLQQANSSNFHDTNATLP